MLLNGEATTSAAQPADGAIQCLRAGKQLTARLGPGAGIKSPRRKALEHL